MFRTELPVQTEFRDNLRLHPAHGTPVADSRTLPASLGRLGAPFHRSYLTITLLRRYNKKAMRKPIC